MTEKNVDKLRRLRKGGLIQPKYLICKFTDKPIAPKRLEEIRGFINLFPEIEFSYAYKYE